MAKHQQSSHKQAKQIAKQLKETDGSAIGLIRRIITDLGFEKVKAWADQAIKIEHNGGMWVEQEQRKRSTSGIFFYLLKQELSPEARKAIFRPGKRKKKRDTSPVGTEAQKQSATNQHSTKSIQRTTLPKGASKLDQLQIDAETLRERIAIMESEGKKGVKMTKLLLANTEKQIEKLTS